MAPRATAITELAKMLIAGGIRVDPLTHAPQVSDIRRLAMRRLPQMAFDFVDGGADNEITLRNNVADLARISFVGSSLRDVSEQHLATTVVGQPMPMPLILGPCGLVRIVGRDGELSAVRAAGKAGLTYTISTASSWSIEEIAEQATGPLWFQLYLWRSRAVVETLVDRARAAGCSALVVTIDVPVNGKRGRDQRNAMSIPPQVTLRNAAGAIRHPAWFRSLLTGPPIGFRNLLGIAEGSSAMSHQEYVNTELANLRASWDDLRWLRSVWDGPLLVKGVTSVADVEGARNVGADGIFVSNHGGRQLDSLPSTISVLAPLVDAAREMEVIFDSGVRTGADIVKALGMGATSAAIGRAWVYGVAAAGERGVTRVLDILRSELRETLILLGETDVHQLGRQHLRVPAEFLTRVGAGPQRAGGAVSPDRIPTMTRVVVDVMPKPEILDPQGKAVTGALGRLGFAGVSVRQGKRFELELEGEMTEERLADVRRAAETLLANTVIETFDVRVEDPADLARVARG